MFWGLWVYGGLLSTFRYIKFKQLRLCAYIDVSYKHVYAVCGRRSGTLETILCLRRDLALFTFQAHSSEKSV